MSTSKQMETKVYNLVACLADNYGFDADEAFEFVRYETDIDHVGEVLGNVEPKKVVVVESESDSKIATCRKNIELWQKKLADGKSADADKQREKIDKEQKKLDKLLEKVPVKVPVKKEEPKKEEPKKKAPAKKEEPKKEEPKKEEIKEKRIKRFSPIMASQLGVAFAAFNVTMTDKLKKEFQKYVEDLTDNDFRREGLADHMRAFAKSNAPVQNVIEEKASEDSSDDGESCVSDVEDETVLKPNSKVVEITLDELQKINMTVTLNPPGTFWDADVGRFVNGPEADDDEDFEEVTYNEKAYAVGEKTGRVYEVCDSGDVFAGFFGVGKFKEMTK